MHSSPTRLDFAWLRRALIAGSMLTIAAAVPAMAAEPSSTLSTKAPEASALVATAKAKGSVPVIITLNTPAGAASTGGSDAALKASIKAVVDPFVIDALHVPATAAAAAATIPNVAATSTAARSSGATTVAGVKIMPFLPMVATSLSVADLERIAADPRVKTIALDGVVYPTLTQSVPLIGGDQAATAGATGAGVKVAILDSGVQYSHPFLAGKVTDASCHSTNGGGLTTLCPNGTTTQYGGTAGINCTGNNDCAHGTHVAGIAAGNRPGFTPPRGVAPGATVFAIQVFSRPATGRLSGQYSDLLLGLQDVYAYRTALHIAAANMSLGGGQNTTFCDTNPLAAAVNQLRAAGVAVVISSGNEGYRNSVGAPGCISNAITVGSSTKSDTISSFSNMASMVDVMAPGSSITSSVPTSLYASYDGTSMSAPHVTGAIAVLKAAVPLATVAQIESALETTGVNIVDNRSGGTITKPRINVYLALLRLRGQPLPPANDNFAGAFTAIPAALTPTVVSGTNVSATLQASEPRGNSSVSATVWWKFTATRTEAVQIKTAGSPFDTTLGIYKGSTVSALTQVAFNDDVNGAADRTSRVQFSTVSGQVYYVQVGGYGAARGIATVTFEHPAPANDNFAAASTIPLSAGGSGSATGRNSFATLETGEPKFKTQVNRTLWYKFTAGATRQYEINTIGSEFDTTLGIYRGTALNALTLVGSDDDSGGSLRSLTRLQLTAGTVYFVQLGGYNTASGATKLNILPFGPANDMMVSATPLAGSFTVAAASNVGATLEPGEILPVPQTRGTVWWRFVSTATKTMDVTTAGSAFDTTLAILTQGGSKGLRLVTFNDDDGAVLTSRVRFTAQAGQTYYIQVGGYGLATGAIRLGVPTGGTPLALKSASN